MRKQEVTGWCCWSATRRITLGWASSPFQRGVSPCRDRWTIGASLWRSSSRARSRMCREQSARTGAGRDKSHSAQRALELHICECPDADAGHEHFVLIVSDGIADVPVQKIVADETDGHFSRAEPARIELGLVADLGLQQIVAGSRRLGDDGDVVLREGMQHVDTHQPVGVAPI